MSSPLIALTAIILVGWLLRRYRAQPDATPPANDLWQAFDRGEDPTGDD